MHHSSRRAVLGAGAALLVAPHIASAATGRIVSIAGSGVQGVAVDGELGASAKLNQPYGVIVGPDGWVYWADFGSNRVIKLDPKSGHIAVAAGNGSKGHSGDGGPAKLAQLAAPHEMRFDHGGAMLIAERDANVVRRVDLKADRIFTFVGTGAPGFAGDGGPATAALLHQPHSIALDGGDNLFICDILNNRVRRRDAATGIITTFAGTGVADVTPSTAPLITPLKGPRSIDIAPDGTMYLILREGNEVFAIDPKKQSMTRIAGTGEKGYDGDGGPALNAKWNGPKGIAYAPDHSLYIADTENHVIRRVSLRDGMVTTVAGIGMRADGPDGDPLKCGLQRPHGVYIHAGKLYIGDAENHRIRVIDL